MTHVSFQFPDFTPLALLARTVNIFKYCTDSPINCQIKFEQNQFLKLLQQSRSSSVPNSASFPPLVELPVLLFETLFLRRVLRLYSNQLQKPTSPIITIRFHSQILHDLPVVRVIKHPFALDLSANVHF